MIPAATQPPVSDHVHHALEPAWIELQRLVGWIAFAVLTPVMFVGLGIGWLLDSLSLDIKVLLSLVWLGTTLLLGWLAQAWPAIEYARFSYAFDPDTSRFDGA